MSFIRSLGRTLISLLLLGVGNMQLIAADLPDPWQYLPQRPQHLDHSPFYQDSLSSGPEVTRSCLECHPDAASHVRKTAHWNWLGDPVELEGREGKHRLGKANALNNFCIGVKSNWPRCTTCHVGYGWDDGNFDFSKDDQVDCLVCHDGSGSYSKGLAGLPSKGVDLQLVAASVGESSRSTCGACHFNGGGGNAVKHGDLDQSLLHPGPRVDVHMGEHNFRCTDCHWTEDHNIPGRAISVSLQSDQRITCEQCHTPEPHTDERLNRHVSAIACQTCHIPKMAADEGTKLYWDWSEAGDKEREKEVGNPHEYKAIKGAFRWEHDVLPEYAWFNGGTTHYLEGDLMNPDSVTVLAGPLGSVSDATSKIWPFKVHRGKQIYDTINKTFMIPKTFGEGGYWTDFDWDKALQLGSEVTGLAYSGEWDFAETSMFWPLSHMVSGSEHALQCADCHGEKGRMNWHELGYQRDPMLHGGRRQSGLLEESK